MSYRRIASALGCVVAMAFTAGCPMQGGCNVSLANLPGSLPDATVGQPYSVPLYSPVQRTDNASIVGGSLPPGLSLSLVQGPGMPLTGINVDGTPTTAGTYKATFRVERGCLRVDADVTITVKVASLLTITTTSLPNGMVGQPYSITALTAANGSGNLTWSLAPGSAALPDGLTMPTSGFISGTPTTSGTTNVTVQVRDSAVPPGTATRAFSITIAPAAGQLAITTATLPNGSEGILYSTAIQTSGGLAPLTFSVSAGMPPPGLNLDPTTGVLDGNVSVGGQYNFTVEVQDSGNPPQTASQAYTVLIIQITTATLPDGNVGQAYNLTFNVTGQVPPSTWSVFPGSMLPAGFTINSAGTLSGTPTVTGTFVFTIQVTDSDTPPRSDAQGYTLTFNNPAPVITTLTPGSANAGGAAFTLTVDGQDFISGCEVRWNGAARTTTFVSGTQVTADIPAADIAMAGNASVTVFNPGPGGGTSNAATFTITMVPPPPASSPGVTDLVSQSSTGAAANAGNANSGIAERLIAISRDGNRAVFQSDATNLDPPHRGVFVRDIALGVTRRVSSTLLDAAPVGPVGESVSISADGFWVAFDSRSDNHVAGDTGQDNDVFVVNTCIQQAPVICPPPDWISVMPDGSEATTGSSHSASLSATGRFVAFMSNSPLTGINTGQNQIFLRDRQTNVTTMLSVDSMGNPGVGESMHPAISGNGRFIAFVSDAFNLIANDTNGRADVFLADTCFSAPAPCTPGVTRVSVATGGVEAIGASPFELFPPAISEDGRFVVFTSSASNLVPNDTNGLLDVFLHDTTTVTTTRVSLSTMGAQSSGFSGTVSEDGRFVAFQSLGQAMVHDTCHNMLACAPSTFVVSRVLGGANATMGEQPAISGNGLFVVFKSNDPNLLPAVTAGVTPIYRARTN